MPVYIRCLSNAVHKQLNLNMQTVDIVDLKYTSHSAISIDASMRLLIGLLDDSVQ